MSAQDPSESEFGVLHESAPATASNGSDDDSRAKLERIRDLLFGDAERAQSERSDRLEARLAGDVARLSEALDERFDVLRAELRSGLDDVARRLEERQRDMVDRRELRAWLMDLADRIAPEDHGG